MTNEDRKQETWIIKHEHPDYNRSQIYRDLRDVEKSDSWSDSYGNKFKHIRNIEICDIQSERENIIDFKIIISKLPEKQRSVIVMDLLGYNRDTIAKMLEFSPAWISKIKKDAIKRLKELVKYYGIQRFSS